MPKLFLDTNIFLRLLEGDLPEERKKLDRYSCSISALTVHIAIYVRKLRVPHPLFSSFLEFFEILPISRQTSTLSLEGPTPDYEDNLQLHTALENNISQFLTLDKELLLLGKFQSLRITSPTELSSV